MLQSEGKTNRATAIVSLIAALLGLATVVLGYLYNNANQTITNITNNIGDKSTENGALRDALGIGPTDPIPPPAQPPSDGGTTPVELIAPGDIPPIRHEGRVEVTPRSVTTDLDAPNTDTNWARENPRTGDGRAEGPYMNGRVVGVYNGGEILFLPDGQADYATCSTVQTYDTRETDVGQLYAGTAFCVKTTAGRFAALTLAEEASASIAVFDVTVWEKE